MFVGRNSSVLGLALVVGLFSVTPLMAQFGLEEAGAVPYQPQDPYGYLSRENDPITGDTVLAESSRRRFRVIDNTFFGVGGLDDLMEYYEERGWDSSYDEDSTKAGFLKELLDVDVLYILSHAGVSESTGDVGLAWRNFLGLNGTQVLARDIEAYLAAGNGPKLVVIAGCKTAENRTMADAFGGAFVGFADAVPPTAAFPFASGFLRKIADGRSIQQAWAETPKPPHTLGSPTGGSPTLFLPSATAAD